VRVTIHPRTIDPLPTTVISSVLDPLPLPPGRTVTMWDTYRDPTNSLKLIGGTAFQTPVAGVDYTANSLEDGTGDDLTANITVTMNAFAAAVEFLITNTGTAFAYLTKRELRGKGIYDNDPVTFETYIPQPYGDRPLDIDLLYQSDPDVAQAFSEYLASALSSPTAQVNDAGFDPQRSDALLTQALTRELGDVITATETRTGLTTATLAIVGIDLMITQNNFLAVRYTVVSTGSGVVFILDDPTHGLLDNANSPLGYA